MKDAYEALIRWSHRVSSETRRVLLERAQPDEARYVPRVMTGLEFAALRALVDRVVPQSGTVRIDLAARIDRQLSQGIDDGWRPVVLPPDGEAYRAALRTLDAWAIAELGRRFSELPHDVQERFLERMVSGEAKRVIDGGSSEPLLEADQMKAWFEDLRADAVRLYMAHPETLSRIGYSGIANGGDGEPKSGFVRVGVDERESWEPLATLEPRK